MENYTLIKVNNDEQTLLFNLKEGSILINANISLSTLSEKNVHLLAIFVLSSNALKFSYLEKLQEHFDCFIFISEKVYLENNFILNRDKLIFIEEKSYAFYGGVFSFLSLNSLNRNFILKVSYQNKKIGLYMGQEAKNEKLLTFFLDIEKLIIETKYDKALIDRAINTRPSKEQFFIKRDHLENRCFFSLSAPLLKSILCFNLSHEYNSLLKLKETFLKLPQKIYVYDAVLEVVKKIDEI